MALIFDIETDGFLESVTKIHCLVIKDTETGLVSSYYKQDNLCEVYAGLQRLMGADCITGHNVIKYDIPVIQKLYPWFTVDQSKVFDTLVTSRLIYSDLRERDGANIEKGLLPTKLWASHSLKAWGYRLGILKGEFKEQNGEDAFKVFTPEMLEYCIQDVEVTHVLYNQLTGIDYSQDAIKGEHEVAWLAGLMERSGWPFDTKAASLLYADLSAKRENIRQKMMETFEPLVIERISEKTGKKLKDKVIEFNPGSRDQIAQRLTTKYGWKPKEFTPAGKAKIDEEVLKALDYPEAQMLAEYFLLEKRIGQLAEGEQAWLKAERQGRIHGSINTNGAVTGRCTHQSPNLAQVPSVRALWGKECRSLFTVHDGFSMVGCDLSGLELRCLAHFMARWDDGEYANEVLNGDVHTKNQNAAGLPTRDNAKTFIYGFLYGAGDAKIGSIVGKGSAEGKKLKEQFLAATPALANLRKAVTKAAERGYLIGLDNRKLPIRSAHAALNTLLQSAGALISKRWWVECFLEAERRGLKYGWDGDYTCLGYIHDELQWAVRSEKAEEFGQMVVDAAATAGVYFNFKCPIGAEFKVGKTWCDTH
jgi:DNA polymerase I-like protein with 3'-5' exonuclease and polymerase domains